MKTYKLYSVKAAAERLGVSRQRVDQLIRSKRIKIVDADSETRMISAKELEKFIEGRG